MVAPLAEVLARHGPALLARPGVHGVAEGRTPDGLPCVLVLVEPGASPDLPATIEGWPLRVAPTDAFEARDSDASE